jgi:glycosyltransferase involved in cell wall biosynthesis
MNNKRLVIVYWNLGIGGIQKRIRDMVLDISQKRPEWETHILIRSHLNEGFEEQIPRSPNIRIETYPCDNRKIRPPAGFVFWLLFKYIRLRPQVLLTFLPQLAITLIGIRRLVFWIRSAIVVNDGVVLSTYLNLRGLIWLKPIITLAYNTANRIIVPTQTCQRDLLKNFSIDRRRISVIPNWTLTEKHMPLSSVYDVAYIGRFDAEKNVLSICDIVRKIKHRNPDVRVLLAGSGELLPKLQKQIIAYHLKNTITIKQFHADILLYLRHSKVLLLPSLSEGMPNIVLEAAMCGVPSVVNHFSGADEVVKHGKTGYISTFDTEAAGYILRLLSRERQRRTMGRRAQRYITENYSYTTQKRFIDTLLSKIHG